MKKLKNNKITSFSTLFLIIAFVVCAFSVSTVYANETNSHSNHHCGQQGDDGLTRASEHHLLTQPAPIDTFNVVLPVMADKILSENLISLGFVSKVEVINNQGAPPLEEPIRLGLVNKKVW